MTSKDKFKAKHAKAYKVRTGKAPQGDYEFDGDSWIYVPTLQESQEGWSSMAADAARLNGRG